MEITLNFATEPYQKVQRYLLRWRLVLSATTIVFLVLLYGSVTAYLSWHAARKQVVELRNQIEQQERFKASAEAFLGRPDSRRTRLTADFLNAAFALKAFSWTEVFADLEPIMPPKLHVTSIHPEFTADGRLELHLTVAASARDAGVALVRSLEQSSHFSQAQIIDEKKQSDRSTGEIFQYSITAVYIPGFARGKAVTDKPRLAGTANSPPGEMAANQNAMQGGQPSVSH